jgi:hypothetical protein
MPKELLHIPSNIKWCHATIRPCPTGMETVLCFVVNGGQFSVAFNSLPESGFFRVLSHVRCIRILEYTSAERGWLEEGRYAVLLNDDDDGDVCRALGDYVRWGPISNSPATLD